MPPKKESSDPNKVQNFYEKIPKKLMEEPKNPNYDDHGIKINKHIACIGSTGSGKTNLLMDFLKKALKGEGTYTHITIVTKMEEPLYNYIQSKIPKENFDIFYGLEHCPALESDYWDDKKSGCCLLVFDYMMAESPKMQEKIILPYFIRGRKKGMGISCWYLSQSYYAIPKKIRLQCSYIFLKKIGSNKDINMILRDQSLGLTKDELQSVYKYALGDDFTNFLTVDLVANDENRFRKNWKEIIHIEDFRE
jgi:hypothetical protein